MRSIGTLVASAMLASSGAVRLSNDVGPGKRTSYRPPKRGGAQSRIELESGRFGYFYKPHQGPREKARRVRQAA